MPLSSPQLSGGMRRRLDIALGIIHKPQLLFLDEQTTGLDPQARARIWDEIRKLRDNGMTIFMTTHYLEEADAPRSPATMSCASPTQCAGRSATCRKARGSTATRPAART